MDYLTLVTKKQEIKMHKLTPWLDSLAQQHTPNFAECVAHLGKYFPLLHEFSITEQDSRWHAEGNVAIHTEMVLNELYQLLRTEAAHISGTNRQILILSALLHDIAKPITTRQKEIAGETCIVASKHEEIGASYLATKLIELPLKHTSIVAIMGLVGFHQIPKLLVIKNKSDSDYLHLALHADLALLYWLELADMKGRICEDLDQQIALLALFKLFAEEYQLWEKKDPSQSLLSNIQIKPSYNEQIYLNGYAIRQLATGLISTPEEAVAKNYQAAQAYSHLYVMCGISGSGKSTWIAQHLPEFEVISLDDIRTELNGKRSNQKNRGQVLQLAKLRLKTALANKRNVVWDATNIRKDFRKIICDFGINYGALITIVTFQMKESSLRKNNKDRQHAIGDDIITSQLDKLEWPSFIEGHRMLTIGEKGKELFRQGTF